MWECHVRQAKILKSWQQHWWKFFCFCFTVFSDYFETINPWAQPAQREQLYSRNITASLKFVAQQGHFTSVHAVICKRAVLLHFWYSAKRFFFFCTTVQHLTRSIYIYILKKRNNVYEKIFIVYMLWYLFFLMSCKGICAWCKWNHVDTLTTGHTSLAGNS